MMWSNVIIERNILVFFNNISGTEVTNKLHKQIIRAYTSRQLLTCTFNIIIELFNTHNVPHVRPIHSFLSSQYINTLNPYNLL